MGTVNIQFGKFQKELLAEVASGPLPEIVHQFRAPDKRPPAVVSFAFTALVLAPFLFFLVGVSILQLNSANVTHTHPFFFSSLLSLFKTKPKKLVFVGANVSNFPFNSTAFFFAAGFQGCIGSIFALFFIYWLRLNMVQTLCYLLALALAAIFFGQYALRYVASLRSHKKVD